MDDANPQPDTCHVSETSDARDMVVISSGMAMQLALERAMKDRGEAREGSQIRQAIERGDGASTPAGLALLKRAIAPASAALSQWVVDAYAGKAGRRHTAAPLLKDLDPDFVVYIALRRIISLITDRKGGCTVRLLANAIGQSLDWEVSAGQFEEAEPGLYAAILANVRKRGSMPIQAVPALKQAEKFHDMPVVHWTPQQAVHVGLAVLDLITTALPDLFEVYEDVSVGKYQGSRSLRLSPAIHEWLAKYNLAASLSRPLWLPTVVRPRDWDGLTKGGYHSSLRWKTSLVTRLRPKHRDALAHADLTNVYKAVNAVQSTPWRVNARVLAVAQQLWKMNQPVGGLPAQDNEPIPTMPPHIVELPTNHPDRRAWRRAVSDIHARNGVTTANRLLVSTRLDTAQEFSAHSHIYFPHMLDFRGRMYPLPAILSPQGDDFTRSLLEFADGKPLGSDMGPTWFAIHGANLFGYDKVSLADREAWAYEHSVKMTSVARDPFKDRWWTEADKPWSFLAFCFEWEGYIREGYDYVSRQPIALDGSCNGLQHYAAMLRDPVAGAAVNLVPANIPSDIYATVATRAKELLAAEDDEANKWVAASWLAFGIDRKITKRAVMVLPYGGTFRACMSYVREAVDERIAAGAANPFGDELGKRAAYLAQKVWQAMDEIIVSGRVGMTFVQSMARALAAEGKPFTWSTPDGFPVVQINPEIKSRRIDTKFHGTLLRLRDTTETDKLDRKAQATGSAPNFVHSLDATALRLTVLGCVEKGITGFAMIHDSYGTHACDTQTLSTILRAKFSDMYLNHSVLDDLRSATVMALSTVKAVEKLPPVPTLGSLDLNLVKSSRYFFA